MLDKFLLVIFLILLAWPAMAEEHRLPAQKSDPFPLTLHQAVRIALENNLNLKAEELDTRASQALVQRGYGLYDPRLLFDLAIGERQERLNEVFFGSDVSQKYRLFNISLSQNLPTGAQMDLSFQNLRSDQDPAPGINPAYSSLVRLSLVQPLLQGFGSTVTEQEILFAVKDREVSVNNLREQALQLLAQVRDTYFEALRLRENLDYRETSVDLAARILAETRARVEAGALPPVDILEAEVGLKQRQRDRLDAERALLDSLDRLAVLLGIPGPVALAQPALEQPDIVVDQDRAFLTALVKRPDLQARLRQIEKLELESRIRRNDLLPELDLAASYGHSGLGSSYGRDLEDIGSGDFPSWELGLLLSYPLGNREARYDYKRIQFLLKGERARVQQFKHEILQEIRAAIRQIEVTAELIDVSASGLEFAKEKLRILLKRQEVGLATTRDVLEGEEDLAEAKTDLTAARANYNKAITLYYQVTGLLLEEAGVRFAGNFEDESRSMLQLGMP
ncbi:MAG: TolC family protein [Syntrophotaleaceae bacterium]